MLMNYDIVDFTIHFFQSNIFYVSNFSVKIFNGQRCAVLYVIFKKFTIVFQDLKVQDFLRLYSRSIIF